MDTELLEIGAGPHSSAKYQIDIAKFNDKTQVLDVSVNNLPFADNSLDEVHAYQILEHIPVVIYYGGPELKDLKRHYARIHVLKEIYRVLKPGGIFKLSIPTEFPFWAQDPTHCDVPWTHDTIEYYCGGWGANVPGDFATEAYGINFAFMRVECHQASELGDFFNHYETLMKPQ